MNLRNERKCIGRGMYIYVMFSKSLGLFTLEIIIIIPISELPPSLIVPYLSPVQLLGQNVEIIVRGCSVVS